MLLFFLDSINCTGLFLILVPLRKESVTVIVKNLWGFSTEVLLFELFWKKKTSYVSGMYLCGFECL